MRIGTDGWDGDGRGWIGIGWKDAAFIRKIFRFESDGNPLF